MNFVLDPCLECHLSFLSSSLSRSFPVFQDTKATNNPLDATQFLISVSCSVPKDGCRLINLDGVTSNSAVPHLCISSKS
ncbi:hypothetical protein NC651_019212 [Populus alba x Populus x berolinensis]|nr:hypothetical protein NC651_019212 [Populus alba x Populus x berolinensis]